MLCVIPFTKRSINSKWSNTWLPDSTPADNETHLVLGKYYNRKPITWSFDIRSRSRNIIATPSGEMHWLTSLGWYELHFHSIVPMDVPRGIDSLTRMSKLRFFTRMFDWTTVEDPLGAKWILSKICTPNSAGKYHKS